MRPAPPMMEPSIASVDKMRSLRRIVGTNLTEQTRISELQHRNNMTNSHDIPASVTQPPLDDEGHDKARGRDGAPGNEERLEDLRANVGYVRNAVRHGGIPWSPLCEPHDEHGPQHACQSVVWALSVRIRIFQFQTENSTDKTTPALRRGGSMRTSNGCVAPSAF